MPIRIRELFIVLSAVLSSVTAAPQLVPNAAPAGVTPAPDVGIRLGKRDGNGCAIASASGYDPATWCACFPEGHALTDFPAVAGACPYGPSSFPSSGITPTATTTTAGPSVTKCSIITTTFPTSPSVEGVSGPQTYCTCNDGNMAGLNLGISGKSSTTYCATGIRALPSGYTQVPYGPGAPKWATDLAPAAPCGNPVSVDPSCWKALDLTDFVNWWWKTNQNSCSSLKLNFSDCFYALAVSGYSPSACDSINANSECKQPVWAEFQGMWNAQRVFYIAWNIWNVNGLFSNYYQAIYNAQGTISNEISSIISTINPVKPVDTIFDDVMTALSVGFAFIPGAGAAFGEGEALVNGLIKAVQQAPGVAKYVFPTGSSASQQFDFNKVTESLGKVVVAFKDNYVSALQGVANDVDNFIAYASNLPLSGQIPDLNAAVDQCLTTLYTFVISQAYQADNVIVTRQVATDVDALCKNGTNLNWDPGCGKGYGQYGECATFFYDGNQDISYALTDTQDQLRDFNDNMQYFFNGMTTGELLLAGADACARGSNSNQGKQPIVDTSPQGSTTPCLSNMQVCTWDLTAKNVQPNPFTDCPSQVAPKFYQQSCLDGTGGFGGGAMPIQYLGWGLLNNKNYQDADHWICEAYD